MRCVGVFSSSRINLPQNALEESFFEALEDGAARPRLNVLSLSHDVEQSLRNLVWDEKRVFGPDVQIGGSGFLGAVVASEGERFSREMSQRSSRLAPGTLPPFPMNSARNQGVAARWLNSLPADGVKTFLLSKEGVGIPRLKWVRQTPSHATPGGPSRDKIVYICGAENIIAFIKWRRRRTAGKFRKQTVARPSAATSLPIATALNAPSKAASNRSCRKCGRTGHISSNPSCPANQKPSLISNGHAQSDKPVDDPLSDEASLVHSETRAGLPVTAVRLTARQQRLLQERHKEAIISGTPVDSSLVKFIGSGVNARHIHVDTYKDAHTTCVRLCCRKWLWTSSTGISLA